ncbi:MAG: glutamate-5-semialdehyde dehydrogenase [Verrucomicrobia bacterium]|nr:glutamate-5-semialdehyde dehydrogenase [Verrucomicrobiota bacterium]
MSEVLLTLADRLWEKRKFLLEANLRDLAKKERHDPKFDRLELNEKRIEAIAQEMRHVAALPSPIGEVIEERLLPNGIALSKVRVPLGRIGVIYEARPNVTFDVFALCFRSGNQVVLKGSADAEASNEAGVALIHEVLKEHQIPPSFLQLLAPTREAAHALMNDRSLDVLIPRGSKELIEFVRTHARIPIIETGAGIVHTYLDQKADLAMAQNVLLNAKTRRVSVCNALDTLILHHKQLPHLLTLLQPMGERGVEIFADPPAYQALQGYPYLQHATADSYGTEFLALKMAVKTVASLEEALAHIAKHSSKHSEAILSSDQAVVDCFLKEVDAAVVYANTSTAFTDGAQFGLGAEIGISTQKLHARGPMGLRELTSYKWIARGSGQIRP